VKNNFCSLALDRRNGVLIGNLLFFYVKKYAEIGYRSGHKKTGKTEKATKKKLPKPVSRNRIEVWAEYKNAVLFLRKKFLNR
jgi:hypothetical protein